MSLPYYRKEDEVMKEIFDYIGNYGFPIVACILMYYQNTKTISSLTAELQKLNEKISNL